MTLEIALNKSKVHPSREVYFAYVHDLSAREEKDGRERKKERSRGVEMGRVDQGGREKMKRGRGDWGRRGREKENISGQIASSLEKVPREVP